MAMAHLRSCIAGLVGGLICGLAFAAPLGQPDETPFVPGFWNQQHRLARPDLTSLRIIRFLTDDDYPPFHFALADGTLTGFDVDIARAICEELKVPCTVQPRRFDTLVEALTAGQGDAVIAGLAKTAELRAKVEFTAPYYRTPARFAMLKSARLADALPETLLGKTIGVEAKTAHEAFVKAFFPGAVLRAYENRDALRAGLMRGEIDVAFDDGISLSFWLNGADARNCCRFIGGPFTESRFFGEGVAIAVRKDAVLLRAALNYALQKMAENGVYSDLYLKYFPVGFY